MKPEPRNHWILTTRGLGKTCPRCGVLKLAEGGYDRAGKNVLGEQQYSSWCKPCRGADLKARRELLHKTVPYTQVVRRVFKRRRYIAMACTVCGRYRNDLSEAHMVCKDTWEQVRHAMASELTTEVKLRAMLRVYEGRHDRYMRLQAEYNKHLAYHWGSVAHSLMLAMPG